MIRYALAAAAVAAFAAPAFAQSAAEMVCAEYSELDNAGKMAMVAELESLNAESAASQELTSAEIEQTLAANCTDNPEVMIVDVIKE